MTAIRTFLAGAASACLLAATSARAQDLYPIDDLSLLPVAADVASSATILQQGERQVADIVQTGASRAELSQTGVDQIATLEQFGFMNRALVEQVGIANRASVSQTGSLNDALLAQSGNGNLAEIVQVGIGLQTDIMQVGDNNIIRVVQEQ